MPTSVASAATDAHTGAGDEKSMQARSMLGSLLDLEPQLREFVLAELTERDLHTLFAVCRQELGSAWGLWQDDPIGFTHTVLRQGTWSRQRAILDSIHRHPRTGAPSAQEQGKTFIAAAALNWHGAVWPVGTSLGISTATRQRQVVRLLWPEIKRLHDLAGLPGEIGAAQWKVPSPNGGSEVISYGFTAPKNDEAAIQGIHAPRLLVVIDEAGGIAPSIGKAFVGLIGSEGTALLAIGNPPTDDEGSWFEQFCHALDTHEIVLDAYASPNFTNEETEACRIHPSLPPHRIASHLGRPEGARISLRDHGADSSWYKAKVRGQFPRGGNLRVIPSTWLDYSRDLANDADPNREHVSFAVDGSPYRYQPAKSGGGHVAWVRLGVDVAAGGGDELAIARAEGDVVRVVHTESGPTLANNVDVAGIVLREIVRAQQLAYRLGTTAAVRVKVDTIGVGWGVCGILEKWGNEGLHEADIVRVNVSEGIDESHRGDLDAAMRPRRKRDEMWLAGRALVQPDPATGEPEVALEVDDRTYAQLSAPRLLTGSDGSVYVESKDSMKSRGLTSPDRGEAVLLAVYEPYSMAPGTRSIIRAGA